MEETVKVYARADANGRITAILNSRYQAEEIEETDIRIGEGTGDAYSYPALRGKLFDGQGLHNYKVNASGDGIVPCTEEDKAAELAAMPKPAPTAEERNRADIDYLLVMGGYTDELV